MAKIEYFSGSRPRRYQFIRFRKVYKKCLHCKHSMESKVISLRVTEDEFDELESLAKSGGHKSKAELVRFLIRQEWDGWAIKVKKHYKEHSGEYTSLEDLKKELLGK